MPVCRHLTPCCAAGFLTGRGPALVCGPAVGNLCPIGLTLAFSELTIPHLLLLKDPAQLSSSSFIANILHSVFTGRMEAIRRECEHSSTTKSNSLIDCAEHFCLPSCYTQFLYLFIESHTLSPIQDFLPETSLSLALSVLTLTTKSLSLAYTIP